VVNNLKKILREIRCCSEAERRWLTPAILATQEAETRRMVVQNQTRQKVLKTLAQKTLHKNRAGGEAQGEGPEFKPQYHQKKKKKRKILLRDSQKPLEIRLHKGLDIL
jgi:hypothetical protein